MMLILPTNKFLIECGIGDTALRDFCNMEFETTEHLFWKCMYRQTFWAKPSNFLTYFDIELI